MTFRTFTHAELVKSPLNVRTNDEDANAVDALSASIVAEGLLEPLVVHPLPMEGHFTPKSAIAGVIAGARRLKAIGQAIERSNLPADFPIAADVREGLGDGQLILLSLSENMLRRELRDYEVHRAIAAAADADLTAETIAADTGQTLEFVNKQLRLGRLAPEIFAAYAEGKLSADQAKAYAATEDHALQLAAYKHFTGSLHHHHGAARIREYLKVGDRELARLLRFVGDDSYRAAGGTFELDLFADGLEERGRVTDEGLLRKLAERKLEVVRGQARVDVQDRDLRFVPEPPKYQGYTDSGLEIMLDKGQPTPDGDVVGTIEIDDRGGAQVRFWWSSRAAKAAAKKTGGAAGLATAPPRAAEGMPIPDDGALANFAYDQAARAAVKDEHGLTSDGLQVMRSLRRDLLRTALITNAVAGGTLGRDYLIWAQLRQELGRDGNTAAGARGLQYANNVEHNGLSEESDWLGEVEARKHWHAAVEELRRQPFMEIDDPAEAFADFERADRETKAIAAAILAGCALLRSLNTPGWKLPVHDELARLAGASDDQLRRFWTPDAAFAGLFPKLKRLELAQPHVGDPEFRSWHKLDDKVLTGAVAGALAAAEGWVHPLLSFGVDRETPAGPEDGSDAAPEEQQAPNVNDRLVLEAAPAPMPA
jgi:ParB family chromosome partitioning protein